MPTYIAIDLKSFYASVECVERGLDPLTTNLVVADASRTEKTICLAVSPSLKAHGISGRARLFEVVSRVEEVNRERLCEAIRCGKAIRREGDGGAVYDFTSASFNAETLSVDPSLRLDYITAPPQMAKYMEYSTKIYNIYLKYVAPEDIHVYSVDECFMDVTAYLQMYGMTARELAMTMIRDVLYATGITATGGIGTNLYLCKVAMDIVAKHVPADRDGVRVAELDEMSYRKQLWAHQPLTDFWRVGKGTAEKLKKHQMFTMGDVARCSLGGRNEVMNERLLYKMFGINAELLIDHAWGWEPCTIRQIKQYRPESKSISGGQVLAHPYTCEKAKLIVREMTELLALDLVEKKLETDQLVLVICYDIENLAGESGRNLRAEIVSDFYGRRVPKPSHGSINLGRKTSSTRLIQEKMAELFDRIVDRNLLVRRVNVVANHVTPRGEPGGALQYQQLDLFSLADEGAKELEEEEHSLQEAMLKIKKRFGKNAILKGMNLEEGATTIERNGQVGGHKA